MNDFSIHNQSKRTQRGKSVFISSQLGFAFFFSAIFFLNFIIRVILSPLMPVIEKDLGFSHAEAGKLFLLISTGYISAFLGSGFISSRITHRNTIILSSVAAGLILIETSLSNSVSGLRIGLITLGMASGIYFPSGLATLTSLISSRHWGKAIAVHELAPVLAFVFAPLVSEALLLWFSWRGVLIVLGTTNVFVGVAYALCGRGGEFRGEAPHIISIRTFLKEPSFWLMIIMFSLLISGSLGVYAILPLYLVVEHGIERNFANTMVALSRISGIGMVILGGWATDRFGPKKTMVCIFLFTGAMTVFLGLSPRFLILFMIFLQPMLTPCFWPAALTALSFIGPSNARNLAPSITLPPAYLIGAGLIPAGIGIMGDAGLFFLGIILVGGFLLIGSLLPRHLKLF